MTARDASGEGVAYHNIPKGEPSTAVYNKVRLSDISIDSATPADPYTTAAAVGWTQAGEWMRYQVSCAR